MDILHVRCREVLDERSSFEMKKKVEQQTSSFFLFHFLSYFFMSAIFPWEKS